MKIAKLLTVFAMTSLLFSSCVAIIEDDDFVVVPDVTLGELLISYDLWYVNINETRGNGEVPFLQRAFTVSFDNNYTMYANNNLVGIGNRGNGLGIDIGSYDTYSKFVEIDHDIDGLWKLEIFQRGDNRIEIYDRSSNTSYYLTGYQEYNFDYDFVFYDNIRYFLQEYNAWEKTFVSEEGALNDFDDENFLAFLGDGNGDTFLSSTDRSGTPLSNVQYDYEGIYEVFDIAGEAKIKTLTLDYDFLGNDYFELYVINDNTIELYHPDSETIYEFKGRGYTPFLKQESKTGATTSKKRKKTVNKTMKVKVKRNKNKS
ncbi:nicotinic acid mononucleotide adenyltransferase [Spongiivirga citrea]|uniref:Nicotinic acid mononucleotide adenyltransferase n=1 Tax=Spongiivirga citrea TaxID=1481457 RepID=A0A6M0CU51_9FLAO|nr:nicotinic acid mononucleotide adenyltransferase [Spongiivirga citrea]NER17300.1 nicotinic acid mononucleotide adenyltransferase [Spongiivirga citrea]